MADIRIMLQASLVTLALTGISAALNHQSQQSSRGDEGNTAMMWSGPPATCAAKSGKSDLDGTKSKDHVNIEAARITIAEDLAKAGYEAMKQVKHADENTFPWSKHSRRSVFALADHSSSWPDGTAADISTWTHHAAKEIKLELDALDLNNLETTVKMIGGWVDNAALSQQVGLEQIDPRTSKIEPAHWLEVLWSIMWRWIMLRWIELEEIVGQCLRDIGLVMEKPLRSAEQILKTASPETLHFIHKHPVAATLIMAAVIAPAIVYTPAFTALGFGPSGPVAGSIAASLQSAMGGVVPAGGIFAHLQSAAMGGYGVAKVEVAVRTTALLVAFLIKLSEVGTPAEHGLDPWAGPYGHM